LAIADAEVSALMRALPESLRDKLAKVSVTFRRRPQGDDVVEDGDEYDLLGLFVGVSLCENDDTDPGLSPEIRLFLDNIRDEADGDETAFRREVRDTLLHEIGHYLGLDENGVELRGL